jgi:predicted DNA-binding ribbon-helix-helix protein
MISTIFKRTITIDGHKTSVTLEDEFWMGLREIARHKNTTLRSLITQIDDARERNNLSSAIRVFVLNHFRAHAHSVDRNIIFPHNFFPTARP